MIIQLKITYGPTFTDGSFQPFATYTGYGFDTDSKSIVSINGTWRGAFIEPKPADILWPANVAFWIDCELATAANEYEGVGYYHVLATGAGLGTFRTQIEPQCVSCGFQLPVDPPPACNLAQLTAVVAGQQVTLSATGNRGPLRYSLDDGLTTQTSNIFRRLAAGDYTATLIDTGTPNCKRTVDFRIEGVDGPLPDIPAPVGAPASLTLALQPVWEIITGLLPGALVRLELWLESQHQLGDYARIFRAQKRADANGTVSFQLDSLLRSRLRHVPQPATAEQTVLVGEAVRNYFCRLKDLDAVSGLESNPRNCPLRTVLLASLDKDGYFLSNQPNEKTLYPGQQEHLYWRSPHVVSGTVTVRRAVVLANGLNTVTTEVVNLAQGGAARYRLLAVPVVPGGVLPAGTARVEVQLTDEQGAALSEVRVYQVRPAVEPRRQFVFATPFGGLDTLVAVGPGSKSLEVKVETAERAELPGDGAGTAQAGAWGFEEQRRYQVATGPLSKEQLHWLQGLALARQLWYELGGQLVPILLLNRKLTYQRDGYQREGLRLEFELASAAANREEVR